MSRRYQFPRFGINTVWKYGQPPREERIIMWTWNHHHKMIILDDIWAAIGIVLLLVLVSFLGG